MYITGRATCSTVQDIVDFCGPAKILGNGESLCASQQCTKEKDRLTCCDDVPNSASENLHNTTPYPTKAKGRGKGTTGFFNNLFSERGGLVVMVFVIILIVVGAGMSAIAVMSIYICRKRGCCGGQKNLTTPKADNNAENEAMDSEAGTSSRKLSSGEEDGTPNDPAAIAALQTQLDNMQTEVQEMFPTGVPTWTSMRSLLTRPNLLRTFKTHCMLARCLVHESVITLMDDYIALKRRFGTFTEKQLYQTMTHEDMITRMLRCRMLTFVNRKDNYTRRDGRPGTGLFVVGASCQSTCNEEEGEEDEGEKYKDAQSMPDYADESMYADALQNPTDEPKHRFTPLTLADYMCYDEVEIAALLSFGGPTLFLNEGHRENKGFLSNDCCPTGLYVGCVGARLEKVGRMESRFMLVTKQQNTAENGYGPMGSGLNSYFLKAWATFYNVQCFPLYTSIQPGPRYQKLVNGDYLDRHVYRKRIRFTILPFLCYADQQAGLKKVKAYVHVVALGLGKWSVHECQAIDQIEVYGDLLEKMKFENISDLNFSGFADSCVNCRGAHDGELLAGIKIHFSNRNPAAALTGDDAGKLLVAQYAWNGNSFPGNEYWGGWLETSNNTSAACCSTIALNHNPIYNQVNIHAGNSAIYSSHIYNNMRADAVPYSYI